MRIINPIYDVAFKYLLEDIDIAKNLIGKIIGEEIVSLAVQPQEITAESEKIGILILRLDFKATIQTKEGEFKTVLIELQKAKMYDDLIRFRRYLGENYTKQVEIKTNGLIEKRTLPITTIYFLGFPLPGIDTSVLKINREYIDLIHNKKLQVKTEFVEKLTHDSFIILIPKLPEKERTELEGILQVFNQSYQVESDPKLLEVNEKALSKSKIVEKILARLQKGAADKDVLNKMLVEEEVESTIDHHIREKELQKEQFTKQITKQNELLKDKDELLKDKDEALKEQQKIIETLKQQLKNPKK